MELLPETINLLEKYDWPGNVRELENVIQRAVSLSSNPCIYPKDLFMSDLIISDRPITKDEPVQKSERPNLVSATETQRAMEERLQIRPGYSVSEMEKKLIILTLEQTGGNRTHAAQLLGISLRTLRNKLREYRLAVVSEGSDQSADED